METSHGIVLAWASGGSRCSRPWQVERLRCTDNPRPADASLANASTGKEVSFELYLSPG